MNPKQETMTYFLLSLVIRHGFRLYVGRKLLDELPFVEKLLCDYPEQSIKRNGENHSEHAPHFSRCKYHYEYFQRMSLNALGINKWLKDEVIYQLHTGKHAYELDNDRHYVQTCIYT